MRFPSRITPLIVILHEHRDTFSFQVYCPLLTYPTLYGFFALNKIRGKVDATFYPAYVRLV